MQRVWGGIEGGGTRFRCLLGSGPAPADIVAEDSFPTTTPAETLAAVAGFFVRHQAAYTIAGLGVACFGPVELDPTSPRYGWITTTPKPGWTDTDVVGLLQARLGMPVAWETDVNGALIGEHRWGAARGLRSAVYFTIGTGIGGGALVDGRPVHGLLHPEMGHIPIAALAGTDGPFAAGACPYHGGGCLEGVASGLALAARAGRPLATLPPDDPLWEDEARYLAYAATVATLLLSPQRIIFGGGVMLNQPQLFPLLRTHLLAQLNGYVRHPAITDDVATYLVPPLLGARAGVLGALALAMDATGERR
jgi:fructokinase